MAPPPERSRPPTSTSPIARTATSPSMLPRAGRVPSPALGRAATRAAPAADFAVAAPTSVASPPAQVPGTALPTATLTAVPPPVAPAAALPMTFEPNRGQTDPAVRFLTRAGGGLLYFTAQG